MDYEIEEIAPKKAHKFLTEEEIIAGFDELYDVPHSTLLEFLSGEPTLFVLNDLDRATPTAEILGYIDKYLKANGTSLEEANPSFIIATGTHKTLEEDGLRRVLGEFFDTFWERKVIWNHVARDKEAHEHLFTTSRGTPVMVDKRLLDFKRVLNINSVEPHYFAGYTGGRKSFLPGISAYETVENNHRHSMHEMSQALVLDGNPIHEDMMEAVKGVIERLNLDALTHHTVVVDGRIYAQVFGNIFTGMERISGDANEAFCVPVKGKFDITIAHTAFPQNQKLYQALKAFENGKLTLREGGILILEATCEQGLGPENFYKVMTSSNDPAEIIRSVEENYSLGAQKTTNVLNFLTKGNKMYIVSQLDDEVVRNCFCTPFKTVEEAVDAAVNEIGIEKPRILRMHEANSVVPLVE